MKTITNVLFTDNKRFKSIEFEELIKIYELTSRIEDKLYILGSIKILGYYDDLNRLLFELKKENSEMIENVEWLKLCLFNAVHLNDEYQIQFISHKLENELKVPKYAYGHLLCSNIDEIQKFYCEEILPNINIQWPRKISSIYKSLYYWNKITNNNHVEDKRVEKSINKDINQMQHSDQHNVNELALAENVINAFSGHRYSKNEHLDILTEINNINNMLNLLDHIFYCYSDEKKKQISNMYISASDYAYYLTDQYMYIDNIKSFIDKNRQHIGLYYRYLYQDNSGITFEQSLQELCDENNVGKILDCLLVEIANDHSDSINEARELAREIKNENCKNVIVLMCSYADYISGSDFPYEEALKLLSIVNIPSIVEIAIKFENGMISEESIDSVIERLDYTFLGERLFMRIAKSLELFSNNSRLLNIIRILDTRFEDTKKIILYILKEVLEDRIVISYKDFDDLAKIVFALNDININTAIIIISLKLHNYNDLCMTMVQSSIKKLDNNLPSKNFNVNINVLYNYILFMVNYFNIRNGSTYDLCDNLENVINNYGQEKTAQLKILAGLIYPEIVENSYPCIIEFLFSHKDQPASSLDFVDKEMYRICFVEYTIHQNKSDYGVYDKVYYKDNESFAMSNNLPVKYYKDIGVNIVSSIDIVNGYDCGSLVQKYISAKVFRNYHDFGLKSFNVPKDITGQDLLRELGKQLNFENRQNSKENLINGANSPMLFSVFNSTELIKETQKIHNNKEKTKLFYKINNEFCFLEKKKLIHPSTLILLSVIDALCVVDNNDSCYVSKNFADEIITNYSFPAFDFADGILYERVFIDETVEKLAKSLANLQSLDRTINFPEGNLFTNTDEENMPLYDIEVFKALIRTDENMFIVSDDKFYYATSLLKARTTGSFSLVCEAYNLNIISDKKLYEITCSLFDINYGNLFSAQIVDLLIGHLDSRNPSDYLNKTIELVHRGWKE